MTKKFSSDPYDHDMIRVKINRNGMDEFIPAPKELSDAMDQAFEDDGDNDPLRHLEPSEIQQIRWRVLQTVYPLLKKISREGIEKVLEKNLNYDTFSTIYHETDLVDELEKLINK